MPPEYRIFGSVRGPTLAMRELADVPLSVGIEAAHEREAGYETLAEPGGGF